MEGHAEKRCERCCESTEKDVSSLQQVSTPRTDDHEVLLEDDDTTRGLPAVRAQIVLMYSYLTRIGRPELLWFSKYAARSVTQWNKTKLVTKD